MKILVKQGSTGWVQAVDITEAPEGYVVFEGAVPENPVWDDLIGNIREKNADELFAEARAHRLAAIRFEAKKRIEIKWPDWLQRNIALGLDPDLAQPCADDIAAVRTASNAAEDAINAATTVAEVEAVSVSWPVL